MNGETQNLERIYSHRKIAVLLSAYNGEKYISEQIDSILEQNSEKLLVHLFIRDDGSKDYTSEIIREKYLHNKNITLIQGKNIGLVASFFRLVEEVKGRAFDYVALSDQDDVWDKDKLEIAINSIEPRNNKIPQLYASSSKIVDENLKEIKRNFSPKREICLYNSIIQNISAGHTYVMNKRLLEALPDKIKTECVYMHDSFILNVAVICGEFYYDETPHVLYRQHLENRLGRDKNLISWFVARLKRVQNGESIQYAKQIEYIFNEYKDKMNSQERKEIEEFLKSRNHFKARLQYIKKTKLYRQETIDTIAFKLLYIFAGYNS